MRTLFLTSSGLNEKTIAEPQYSLQYKTASTFVGAIFRFILLRFLENLSGEYTGD